MKALNITARIIPITFYHIILTEKVFNSSDINTYNKTQNN